MNYSTDHSCYHVNLESVQFTLDCGGPKGMKGPMQIFFCGWGPTLYINNLF